MIVTSSGYVIAGLNRIVINDSVNEFLGTVNNQWSNAANWSLGVIPAPNHVAVIKANCTQNINGNVRVLMIDSSITFTQNFQLTTTNIINSGIFLHSHNLIITDGILSVWGNFIRTTDSFEIQFSTSDTFIIPNLNYWGLRLNGGNRILGHNLVVKGFMIRSGNLDMGTFNLIVEGNDTASNFAQIIAMMNNRYTVYGSSQYNVGVFVAANLTSGTTFEFRNGLFIPLVANVADFGESEVRFTTNSLQSLNTNGNYNIKYITIENGITLRHVTTNSPGAYVNNTRITGTNSTSILDCRFWFNFIGANGNLMPIGLLYTNQAENAFSYGGTSNQDIRLPDDGGYRELRLRTSGVKRLIGNTVCTHLYFEGTATLDLNGFTLSGYTKYTDNGTVNRNLPSGTFDTVSLGNVGNTRTLTLTGNLTCTTFDASASWAWTIVNNGFSIITNDFRGWYRGNASVYAHDYSTLSFTNAGVKTLTGNINVGTLNINSQLNGITFSGFTMNVTNINYTTATGEPTYPFYAGTYTTCNITGTGSITLQGNVVVTSTYSRAVGVTFNKNGFTIKNGSGVDLE